MISFPSVRAIIIRHVRVMQHDRNMFFGAFYWPLLDVLIWGFLGSWISATSAAQLPNYEATALLGLLLWQVVGRGCNLIVFTLCEELWSYNIVNLFSLPLRLIEWIIGTILFTAIMIGFTSLFCMSIIFALYDVSIWYFISTYLIFAPPLFLSMLWIGFTALQVVVTLGRRGTELGFVAGWSLMPFSGAFYPVEVLPHWGQMISACLPMSYVFQGLRGYVMYQQDPTMYLIKGYLLGLVYAIVAIAVFVYCFKRSKQKGLVRLTD